MAKTVNVHAAKTHLSRLIEEAVNGEDVVIARSGRPVVRLVAINPDQDAAERRRRSLGSWSRLGEVWMADDFNELGDDLARAFGIDPEEERRSRRALQRKALKKKRAAR